MDTTRRVKRRIWPEALKREIVAAAAAPGASVSIVARHHNLNTNLVFTWRKLYGNDAVCPPAPQLVPVRVTADPAGAASGFNTPALAADVIAIDLPGGALVRVGPGVKAAALRLVLDALARR
jgi:transposase